MQRKAKQVLNCLNVLRSTALNSLHTSNSHTSLSNLSSGAESSENIDIKLIKYSLKDDNGTACNMFSHPKPKLGDCILNFLLEFPSVGRQSQLVNNLRKVEIIVCSAKLKSLVKLIWFILRCVRPCAKKNVALNSISGKAWIETV